MPKRRSGEKPRATVAERDAAGTYHTASGEDTGIEIPRNQFDVVVVGAGFAGAATARSLALEGVRSVLVVDQERAIGAHSSGRNAGMVRRVVEDPALMAFTREGAEVIADLGVPFRRTGSYLLGARERVPAAVIESFAHRFLLPDVAARRVPWLASRRDTSILETPDDGIVEVHALLERYLAEARDGGACVALGRAVTGIRAREGRVEGVEVDGEVVRCRHVVLGTGAWAAGCGADVGCAVDLRPRRRHIVCTPAPTSEVPRHWPWVWDLEEGYYFRPESVGLLWSPCDEVEDDPGAARTDPEAPLWLAEKLARTIPEAANLEAVKSWAGHRTFAPDGRFLLGPDPRLDGLHWAAGLGGHGVTVSAAVGRRVALGVVGRDQEIEAEHRFRSAVLPSSPGAGLLEGPGSSKGGTLAGRR